MADQKTAIPNDPYVDLVVERWQKPEQVYRPFFRRIMRFYDTYRMIYTGRYQPFRNNVALPLLFSVVQSDIARKVQTSFSQEPYVEFSTPIPEARQFASKVESLVSQQWKDDKVFSKAVDFCLSADLYGTGIMKLVWKQDIRQVLRQIPSAQGLVPMPFQVKHFDGPSMRVVDILDLVLPPGFRTIEEAPWVVERSWVDRDMLLEAAQQGMYDQDVVLQMVRDDASKAQADYIERRSVYRSYNDFQKRAYDKYARPIKILEMWGRVPYDLAPDGFIHRVITVANDKYLLRNVPNPFYHGMKPYLAYSPMRDPHYFHSPGKIEVAERLNYAANRYANQKLDIMDLVADPVFIFNRTAGIDPDGLFTRAGKNIGVDGPVGDDVIRPLIPDLRGMEGTYTEIQSLWNQMQQGTGIIEDTVQGGPPSTSRQTAREFIGRQENVMTRLTLEALLMESDFVEPAAEMTHALNQQFLEMPKQIQMLGSAAFMDPDTGFPIPQAPVPITAQDLVPDYKARATGASRMLGRAVKRQEAETLNAMISQNPVGMMMINWGAWFKNLFELHDMDSNRYVLTAPNMTNIFATMAANGGIPGPTPEKPAENASQK